MIICNILCELNEVFKTNPISFKMNVEDVGWEDVNCNNLSQDMDHYGVLVNTKAAFTQDTRWLDTRCPATANTLA
jgi:UDP-N-acetylenolpyruvoylglucosamine reductase